jgi:hypothetical protein
MSGVLQQLGALRRQLREQEEEAGDREKRRQAGRLQQLQQDLARMKHGQVSPRPAAGTAGTA